jgi:hypothetical protein
VAALLVVLCLVAMSRTDREGSIGAAGRVALVLIGLAVTWSILDEGSKRHVAAERRALDARIHELQARALTPGSSLACLNATAGETVEAACENALFATPESTAAAVSYASAQLALLSDATDFARRFDRSYVAVSNTLRRTVELDRFGFIGHVLAIRDGCTAVQCGAFSLLADASRVSASLAERTYDFFVVRHAGNWPAGANPPPASPSAVNLRPSSGSPSASALPAKPPGPDVFFPSAASIPPVSIMNAEPPRPPESSSTAQAAKPQPDTTSTGSAAKAQPAQPKRSSSPAPQRAPVDLNAAAARHPAPAAPQPAQ